MKTSGDTFSKVWHKTVPFKPRQFLGGVLVNFTSRDVMR